MLRVLTSGESHGPALTAIVEGLPAGMPVDLELMDHELARRQRGYGRGKRQAIEQDRAEVLSGIRYGRTMPGPVTLVVRNRDYENWRGRMSPTPVDSPAHAVTCPRPGHADLAGWLKYELTDIRDVLERASARTTAALVAAGALCRQLLRPLGVGVYSYVRAIGPVACEPVEPEGLPSLAEAIEASPVRCPTQEITAAMQAAIDDAAAAGDTLGGIFVVVALGVPPGLGSCSQWDRRLDGRLAQALMSVQAVKGVEFGAGFAAARSSGIRVHDEIRYDAEHGLRRDSNNAGGIEGGISNGEPIVAQCAMKPIPTVRKRLASVDLKAMAEVPAHFERSDVCAVPAAAVIAEAMVCIVLADAALERFGGDSFEAFLRNYEAARQSLRARGFLGATWSTS